MGTSRPARNPMDINAPSQGAVHARGQATPVRPKKYLVIATLDDYCRNREF